MLQEDTSKGL